MTNPTLTPENELPDWMKSALQQLDWGAIIIALLSLVLSWQFIYFSGISQTTANENMVYRVATYAEAFQEGILYPIWSAHSNSGLGAPILQYYPPLVAYLGGVLDIFFTGDASTAVQILYILTFILIGMGCYQFLSQYFPGDQSFLASLLILLGTYLGLSTPHITGDLSLLLGFSIIPFALIAMHQLLINPRANQTVFLSLLSSIIILSDLRALICLLILLLILSGYYLYHGNGKNLNFVYLALIISVFITSFYWLPLLSESPNLIHWLESDYMLKPNPFTLQTIISNPYPIDPGFLIVTPRIGLNWVTVILALIGSVKILYQKRITLSLICLITALLLLILLIISEIDLNWLMLLISFFLAIIASESLPIFTRLLKSHTSLSLPILLIPVILSSFATLAGKPPLSMVTWPTPLNQVLYEQQGYGIAVLGSNEPLPYTALPSPAITKSLIDQYSNNSINRIPESKSDTRISPISMGTHHQIYQVSTRVKTSFTVLLAYHPAWRAFLNDTPISLTRREDGLMQIEIPATTEGRLDIKIVPTEKSQLAWLASLLGLIALYLLQRSLSKQLPTPLYIKKYLIPKTTLRLLALEILTIGFFLILLQSNLLPFSLLPDKGYQLLNTQILNVSTSSGLELTAFKMDKTELHPDESIQLNFVWKARRFIPDNQVLQISLQNILTGSTVHQYNNHYPGYYPTRRWISGYFVEELNHIKIPASIPPGDYLLTLEIIACNPGCENGTPVKFFNAQGTSIGNLFTLPQTIKIH
ncbi:hypothetical protein MASR2M15_04260 [Anaerolineales bacterium]